MMRIDGTKSAVSPGLARVLLRLTVRGNALEATLGDLEEEFLTDIASERNWFRARTWYWRQALSLGAAYLKDRYIWAGRPAWMGADRPGMDVIEHPSNDGGGKMESLIQSLKYAVRQLGRTPLFTAMAVAIIALGIGANTAIFSAVNAVLFRPLPFENPDELVEIYQDSDEGDPTSNSYPAYRDIVAHTDLFSAVSATFNSIANMQTDDGLRPSLVEYATASHFPMLGLRPSVGRWFDPEEDQTGAGAFGIVGRHAWEMRFGRDPNIIGQTVRLNGAPVTIVGIGPETYNGAVSGVAVDFWLSISSILPVEGSASTLERRQNHWFMVKARLEPGVEPIAAQTAMTALAARLGEDFPELNEGRDITVFSTTDVRIHPAIDGVLLPAAAGLMAIVGLVLVIACSNLAILLLVRGAGRARDMSIRLAIGANRAQLVRQLLSESVLLSTAGGILGYFVAAWTLSLVMGYQVPADVPIALLDVGLDRSVLAFTMVLSLVTGIAFGLAPAWRASRTDVMSTLKDEWESLSLGRRWLGLKNGLVVFQVAVSVLFLVGAGFFIRSLANAERAEPGFAVADVAFLETNALQVGYGWDEGQTLYRTLLDRIRSSPGVVRAAIASNPPMGGRGSSTMIVEGYVSPEGTGAVELPGGFVGEGYFRTLRIPLIQGRPFTSEDREDSRPVIIVNETLANRYWGTTDVIGRRLRHQGAEDSWMEIVGVVGDTKVREIVEPPRSLFYKPFSQSPTRTVSVLARTDGDGAALVASLRSELRSLDPALPVLRAKTMSDHLGESLVMSRIGAAFLSGFSILALVLAGVGLYALVAFTVAGRPGKWESGWPSGREVPRLSGRSSAK